MVHTKVTITITCVLCWLLLILIGIGPVPLAHAEQPPAIRFTHLNVNEGLSHPVVYAIVQDSRGFMWFGTEDGLNLYDGYTIKTYNTNPNDPNSLSSNAINSLLEDEAGMLWIGTRDGGLNRFDPTTEVFTRYQHNPANPNSLSHDTIWYKSIVKDVTGTLWVGTGGGGLNRYNPTTDTFTHYKHDPTNPNSLSSDVVRGIAATTDEHGKPVLWIATANGLNRFDPMTETFIRYYASNTTMNNLCNDSILVVTVDSTNNVLWLGTRDGLNHFDLTTSTFTCYRHDETNPNSLIRNEVYDIQPDGIDALWISTQSGLDHFNLLTHTFTHYHSISHDPLSLSDDAIHPITTDEAGNLWVGTWGGGVNLYNPSRHKFRLYQHIPGMPSSLSHSSVLGLSTDRTGTLWVGTWGGGLNRYDDATDSFTAYQHDPNDPHSLSHNTVHAIYEDSLGILWIGTYGGLNAFDREQEIFTRYLYNPNDPQSISDNSIRAVVEDTVGFIWIATGDGGVNRFNRANGTFTRYQHDPTNPHSLITNNVWSLLYDSYNTLWIATSQGLDRFDPTTGHFIHYRHDDNDPHSLSADLVMNVYEDHTGMLWITTSHGLNRFDRQTEQFTVYTEQDSLRSNRVESIQEDANGYLWLGTNKGLVRFDPRTITFRTYDVLDGLQSNVFLYPASARLPNGELFFGGSNGINRFHPDDLHDNNHVPPIILTDVQINNEPIDIGPHARFPQAIWTTDHLSLTRDDARITFEFAALDYAAPAKNRYRYQLVGFDKEWIPTPSNRRFATYTNLPPGAYLFRVQGTNNDGVWNNVGVSLPMTIVPSWWETWWFYSLVGILLASVLIGGYVWRVRSIDQHRRTLEREVARRTQELRESQVNLARAHEMAKLGNFYYTIATNTSRWSNTLCRMAGLGDSEQILTMEEVNELVHTDDKPLLYQAHMDVIEQRSPKADLEIRVFYADGTTHYLHDQFEAVYDDQGNVVGTFGTVQDITERKRLEEERRKSEERLRHILDSSPQGILVLDEEGMIHYANPLARQLLNQPQLEGAPFGLPIAECDSHAIEVEPIFGRGQIILELRVIKTDWDNQPSYIVTMNDITERKRAEEALRASEARYRLLTDTMPDVAWTSDMTGRFTFVSPSVYQLRGYTPEEVCQQTMADALTPESYHIVLQLMQEFATTGTTEATHVELEQPCKDGSTVWTEVVGNAMIDDHGQIVGWMGVSRNITDRRQAQARIQKLSQAIEQSSNAVVITDATGAIEYVNPWFTEITGYTAEEVLGQNPRILKSGFLHPEVYADLWRTILSGKEWRGELANKKKDGTLFWEYVSIMPVCDEKGTITHFVAVKEDITERKRIDEELRAARQAAEQANQAKSAFLATMSHELRTPLNVILGFAQIMRRSSTLYDECRSYAASIYRSGDHLLALINDVLDMSKIEAGHITFNPSTVDLHAFLYDIHDMFLFRAQDKGIQLTYTMSPDIPGYIQTDEQKIRQVIINLLANAVKFTPSGGQVWLRAWMQHDKNIPDGTHALEHRASSYVLHIEIADTGPGIPPDKQDAIFEPFVQTESATRQVEGTGLGLAISRRFVEIMGGRLTVSSEVGKGATFTVVLPVIVIDKSAVTSREHDQETRQVVALAPGQPTYRILVVDDHADAREPLTTLLTSLAFDVREAGNGHEAIDVWQTWHPHLIWMDMRMPVLDGYEATRIIKETPEGQATVVIALTASAFDDERDKIIASGCDDYARKPFREQDIFQMMAHHLGVRYLYSDDAAATETVAPDTLLTAETLAHLPPDIRAALQEATDEVNPAVTKEVIEQIRPLDSQLADALLDLLKKYRFDSIAEWLEGIGDDATG